MTSILIAFRGQSDGNNHRPQNCRFSLKIKNGLQVRSTSKEGNVNPSKGPLKSLIRPFLNALKGPFKCLIRPFLNALNGPLKSLTLPSLKVDRNPKTRFMICRCNYNFPKYLWHQYWWFFGENRMVRTTGTRTAIFPKNQTKDFKLDLPLRRGV